MARNAWANQAGILAEEKRIGKAFRLSGRAERLQMFMENKDEITRLDAMLKAYGAPGADGVINMVATVASGCKGACDDDSRLGGMFLMLPLIPETLKPIPEGSRAIGADRVNLAFVLAGLRYGDDPAGKRMSADVTSWARSDAPFSSEKLDSLFSRFGE